MPRPLSFALVGPALALCLVVGCTSLSYEEPDAPPKPPHAIGSYKTTDTQATDWSQLATNARTELRMGDLAGAERDYLASIAATEAFGPRDVRRQTALANPARLVEAYQAAGQGEAADQLTDAVLAEAQGAKPFPLDAWALALEAQLDGAGAEGGADSELDRARRIAEIHLGPLQGATPAEVQLRRRVGLLLAAAGEPDAARAQLGWAARAAQPMRRLPLADRLDLQFEAANAAALAGDPTSAELLLEAALELARDAGDDLQTAVAANQLGWFWVEQDRIEQAVPLLEEARDLLRAAGAPPGIRAATLDSLAVALHRAGRLDEADAVFAEAVAERDVATLEDQAELESIDAHWAELRADRSAQSEASKTGDS
jgi:tetratricopeptide (TPR) repeat protein